MSQACREAPVNVPAEVGLPALPALPVVSATAPLVAPPHLTAGQKLLDVLEVTRALTTEIHLDRLLIKIMDAATRLLEGDRSTLYLIDPLRHELVSKIAQQAEVKEIRLPISAGLAGHTARTGEVVNIPDAHQDDRFHRDFDLRTGYRTRDVLVVPVTNSRNERIGVIQVLNRRRGVASCEDIALLQALASSAGVAIENARLHEKIDQMLQSFMRTLAASIEARDPQTAGHSVRVGGYAAKVVQEIGVDSQRQKLVYMSGLLHDYGKVGVPEAILTKPGRLSGEEMAIMRGHATISYEVLRQVQFTDELNRIPEIVYQHHERIDGGGYPRGLSGSQIGFEGRVLAVCDVFDALTSQRHYREPASHAHAFGYIRDHAGTHFDPEVVAAFGRILRREGTLSEVHPVAGEAITAAVIDARMVGGI